MLEAGTSEHIINYGGRRYTKSGFDAIFKRLVKRSGVTKASAYTIRHTVATELYARGVRWSDVQMFLGHDMKSLGTTGGYIHLAPGFIKEPQAAIDQYFRELSALIARPVVKVELDEQPLPDSLLHPQCTPRNFSRTSSLILCMASVAPGIGFSGQEPASLATKEHFAIHPPATRFGIVNTDFGRSQNRSRSRRNGRSRSAETSGHDQPKSPVTLGRNTQFRRQGIHEQRYRERAVECCELGHQIGERFRCRNLNCPSGAARCVRGSCLSHVWQIRPNTSNPESARWSNCRPPRREACPLLARPAEAQLLQALVGYLLAEHNSNS